MQTPPIQNRVNAPVQSMAQPKPELLVIEPEMRTLAYNTVSGNFNPIEYAQTKMIANDLIQSGAVSADVKNAAQMLMKLWAGRSMGLTDSETLGSLYIVNGQVTAWGKATVNRITKHGFKIRYINETTGGKTIIGNDGSGSPIEVDNDSCTAIVYKGGTDAYDDDYNWLKVTDPEVLYKETYTFADAARSGYTHGTSGIKFGWKEGAARAQKLRYNALLKIIRSYIPEVMGAAYSITEVEQDFVAQDAKEAISKALESSPRVDRGFKPVVQNVEQEAV